MNNTGIPRNRSKVRDNASDIMPSFKHDAEANIGEFFYSRETLKLSYKKGVGDFIRYSDESVPGPQGPQGLPGVGGGGLEGTFYVFVAADGNPTENATELKEKYDLAKTMTSQTFNYSYAVSSVVENAGVYTVVFTNPSNLNEFSYGTNSVIINNIPYTINVIALSTSFGMQFTGLPSGVSFTAIRVSVVSNVKMTLILAPGEYDLNEETFVIDDNLVDIVSLTGNTDVKFTGVSIGYSSPDAVQITANNILVKGIDVGYSAIKIGDNLNQLVVEKCKGGAFSFCAITVYGGSLSSTFNDCVGGAESFGGISANMTGTFNNCVGGYNSFSPNQGYLSGTFNNCKGNVGSFSPYSGSISGVFNNCVSGYDSFGGPTVFVTGTFNNCVSNYGCFVSAGNYGVFNNCQAQALSYVLSYGDPTFNNCQGQFRSFNCPSGYSLQGTYIGCSAGGESFGSFTSINVAATFINCSAESYSFAGGIDNVFTGRAINCMAFGESSFAGNPSSSNSTRITGKIINSQIFGASFLSSAYFGAGGELAGCFDNTGFIASRTM